VTVVEVGSGGGGLVTTAVAAMAMVGMVVL